MSRQDSETDPWDVFVSYSRSDAKLLEQFVPALIDQGLRVFVDDTAVDDFVSITATITRALAQSKILLSVYSAEYPRRRACQWELTYAYLSGQREGDPRRRILVINPEATSGHVHPVELRDSRHGPLPGDTQSARRLAARVSAYLATLDTPMGETAPAPPVAWLPAPSRTGSRRFTGRLAEQWRVHTALHRHRAPLVTPTGDGRTAQLRGMPGIGKSLLAQEYALRFGPSFPGGIFWFDLHSCHANASSDVLDAYAEQVSTVMSALGIESRHAPLPHLLSRLAVAFGERNAPCLWVVDGVPDGLPPDLLELLRGPHLLAATLVTTRSQRYTAFAEPIDLTPLPDADAYHLITSRREPQNLDEQTAAHALIHDLGGHPQALDIVAERSATDSFTHVRSRLHNSTTDVLSLWGRPSSSDGGRTGKPLTAALLARPLSSRAPADDVLRLLAIACPAALDQSALEHSLAAVEPYGPWEATHHVGEAIDILLGEGAVQQTSLDSRSWTVHPLLARAVHRHDSDTARQEDLRRALLQTLANPAYGHILGHAPSAPARQEHPVPRRTASSRSQAERNAAFDLQVELVTRVGVQPLGPDQGSLRETLTSLHFMFSAAREILHRVGADSAETALPRIVSALVNDQLRPFLATWHSALHVHEAACPEGMSSIEHERRWDRSGEMRTSLAGLREPLTAITNELAELSGSRLLTSTLD
ncbi:MULTISPECIES: TIR domain-containing protein [unclassified Streptomyces]|uniref:tetratricopeptide repeat protein n=1 Tax=unclassified Streptomyces TaxID=2593676 RepID=UPI00381EDAB6